MPVGSSVAVGSYLPCWSEPVGSNVPADGSYKPALAQVFPPVTRTFPPDSSVAVGFSDCASCKDKSAPAMGRNRPLQPPSSLASTSTGAGVSTAGAASSVVAERPSAVAATSSTGAASSRVDAASCTEDRASSLLTPSSGVGDATSAEGIVPWSLAMPSVLGKAASVMPVGLMALDLQPPNTPVRIAIETIKLSSVFIWEQAYCGCPVVTTTAGVPRARPYLQSHRPRVLPSQCRRRSLPSSLSPWIIDSPPCWLC